MSHRTGWQGERKRVWEHNLSGKKGGLSPLKMLVSEQLTKTLLKRYSTDEMLPSNFPWHVSQAAVRCMRAQWVFHRGAGICCQIWIFPWWTLQTRGTKCSPFFSREEQGSTKWSKHSAGTEWVQRCCSQPSAWISCGNPSYGKFWILEICVGSGKVLACSWKRSSPRLLTRKTLYLWLNTSLNHEELEDRKLFGYVSLYHSSTPVLISMFSLKAGSGK